MLAKCEPAFCALGRRTVPKSYPSHAKRTPEGVLCVAGVAGFEPAKMPESKSGALPLGDSPI